MDYADRQSIGGGLRPSYETAIDESGVLGTHRRCTNINMFEIVFLILGVLAAIATDGITIYRFTKIHDISHPDIVYGVLIIVNSVFLLIFLITGILQQRITDIVAFFISALMLTAYVIAHYFIRQNEGDHDEATTRLIRLICTCAFNICFIPLSIIVIRDYQRDEFSKRLFGVFPAARWPLKAYNIFDCIVRINTMISIATLLLNLYNFNRFLKVDDILLGIGIPLTFIWLGVGVGMARLESYTLAVIFYLLSLFQFGFIGYALYSAITDPAGKSTTTTTTIITTGSSIPTTTSSTTSSTVTSSSTTTAAPPLVNVTMGLYVCIGINLFTHIFSLIFASICIRNFGKGLKEKVFNNQFDKWIQKTFSRSDTAN